MRLNRWLNPSLPQTLQIATFLFYINAGFNVILSLIFPVALFLLVIHPESRSYQKIWFS